MRLVVLDMGLPDVDGEQMLPMVLAVSEVPIVATARGRARLRTAVASSGEGAWHTANVCWYVGLAQVAAADVHSLAPKSRNRSSSVAPLVEPHARPIRTRFNGFGVGGMVSSSGDGASRLMLNDRQIAAAGLQDWRKLGQGLHARYETSDFLAGARFLSAIGEVGRVVGHSPQVRMDTTFVDLKLITVDAVHRDADGHDHDVEWVTEQDLALAGRISDIAKDQGLDADPSSITTIEIVLDTAHADRVAPVWSALLTGGQEAQGRGTTEDDVRDVTWRMPILWFQQTDEHETPRQRFHIDVQVPHDIVERRIAAAVAAGGVIVAQPDPTTTVIADPDGNKACIGTSLSPDET